MRYCLLCFGFVSFSTAFAANVAVVEEIVCKVNGDIITRTELEKDRLDAEAEFRQQGLAGQALRDAVNASTRELLRKRIDQLLLVQKGKELDLKVDADVTKRLANMQRQSGISDPEKFQEYVRDHSGMPFEDYKNEIKDQLLIERTIRQEVTSSIKFKREDLEQYYNDHKDEFQRKERIFLSDIYVSTEGKDAAGQLAAEKKAKDLSARGKKGEKFSEMAQTNSDAQDAANGGELPPYEKGQLRADIENAVWDKQRGFVTDPIKLPSPPGYYVFKVEDHQQAGLAAFEEVQNEVENRLFQPKMDPAVRAYLTKLRTEAFLNIKPGYVDSGAAPGKNTAWEDPAELKPETVTKEEVAAKPRKRKLLWVVPIPGTNTQAPGTSSSKN
ncbi:MAG TPA: peptidylprolyl isomerase [Bryobacteraceae bacterium]|nr:peptidylprolyl isomerase [Bryobacteraceae bacterium]